LLFHVTPEPVCAQKERYPQFPQADVKSNGAPGIGPAVLAAIRRG
jgi:hypothetical protein